MSLKTRKQKNNCFKVIAFFLAVLITFSTAGSTGTQAAITDNIGTSRLEQTIGSYDDISGDQTLFGLIREIINYVEDMIQEVSAMRSEMATMKGQIKTVNDKIDSQTVALTGTIENTLKKATAAYNLYVYIPKSLAAYNYAGQTVRLTTSSGQSATAALEDDGTNYSTRLYFDFGGDCTLSYNLVDSSGVQTNVSKGITISQTGQEDNLLFGLGAPKNMSWSAIHAILQNGAGSNYSLMTAGTELPGGWYVIGSSGNNVRIWRKTNVGSAIWSKANSTATLYYSTFNSSIAGCSMAYSSGLLSKEDVESGWLASNRNTESVYWLSTDYYDGIFHWYVTNYRIEINDYYDDLYEYGCFPAVWIN